MVDVSMAIDAMPATNRCALMLALTLSPPPPPDFLHMLPY